MKLATRLPAAAFALLGVFAVSIGATDTITAPAIQYQIIGATFALAGCVLLAGCWCILYSRWRNVYGHIAVIGSGLAGGFIGGYLALMQVIEPGPPDLARLPLWCGISLVAMGAAILGWTGVDHLTTTQIRMGPVAKGAISTVGIIGLLAGGAQWWYTNQYTPESVSPALAIDAKVAEYGKPPTTGESSVAIQLLPLTSAARSAPPRARRRAARRRSSVGGRVPVLRAAAACALWLVGLV